MALESAHKGYEYQDLLTAVFIIEELLISNNSKFIIDRKENEFDKFDDLTIENSLCIYKKQIKYSETKVLSKADLSQTKYDLALDTLFLSWKTTRDDKKREYRICLAWEYIADNDELSFLIPTTTNVNTYENLNVKYLKVDIEKIWPAGEKPVNSWRRLRDKSNTISRQELADFFDSLIIEVNLPKASNDLYNPDELEKYALRKLVDLGIGKYPNDKLNTLDVLSNVLLMVKGSRASGKFLVTSEVLYKINVITSFGSIKQDFHIHEKYNVVVEDKINLFIEYSEQKTALIGAPGSGKSWFVNNLVKVLKESGIAVVRHFCFTSLNDEFETKRITTNVFMANLLNEIIENYPGLSAAKTTIYGVDFDELQKVVSSIDKVTWIIIDGLDHIERIYNLHSSVLKKIDTDIINIIGKLKIPNNVNLLLVSQPINDIALLTEQGYHIMNIPKWNVIEVKRLLRLYDQEDIHLNNHEPLSDYLLEKSEGNPLYLTYLLKEIMGLPIKYINKQNLSHIPNYNDDLNDYYFYLISKIDQAQRVAQVMSGAHFYLSLAELVEITKQGIFVEKTINEMKSVLEHNSVSGGYLVYHESFRRFIIEDLESKGIDPTEVIYKDLIDWLKAKGFYESRKAYLNLLFMMYESKKHNEIADYIGTDFVVNSMISGQSITAIKRNYAVLLKSACELKDYKLVIKITEISGMIDALQYSFDDNEELFYVNIGSIFGYEYLNELLMYEGKRNLSLLSGLKVCYICSENGVLPYWKPYIDHLYLLNIKEQLPDWDDEQRKFVYRSSISSVIDMKNEEDIVRKIRAATEEEHEEKKLIIISEFAKRDSIKKLTKILEKIQYLQRWQTELVLALEYGRLEYHDYESTLSFFEEDMSRTDRINQIRIYRSSIEWIAHVDLPRLNIFTLKISNRNWFYNWLIFVAKISESIVHHGTSSEIENLILENYQILLEDTEVFKGEPRTCDLYNERNDIYNSLLFPLKYIKSTEGWQKVVSLLKDLSEKTVTYLQGAQSGPLTSDKLIELYIEICNESNVDFIVKAINNKIESDRTNSYYSYLADYSFKLGRVYSSANLLEESKSSLKEGVKYLLSYTFRKDRTLSHVLDCVEATLMPDKEVGIENIMKLKTLADAVTMHTDGKSTKTYPREWFELLVGNDLGLGLSYLAEILPKYRSHWIYEECLKVALIEANGQISPEVESILYKTLPNCKSPSYLNSYLNVIEKLFENGKYDLGIVDLNELSSRLDSNEREKINDLEFLNRLSLVCEKYNVEWDLVQYTSDFLDDNEIEKASYNFFDGSVIFSRNKSLDQLSRTEILDSINQNGLKDFNSQSLIYYFDGIKDLNKETKTFLYSTVECISKSFFYSEKWDDFIEIIDSIKNSPDVQAYLYILVFLNHQDGWLQGYTRKDIFNKAFNISKEITEDTLFGYMGNNLKLVDYGTTIGGKLINALSTTNEYQCVINECWNEVFEVVNIRLPGQIDFDWEPVVSINESWNDTEKMVYLLLSRLRFAETYRAKWVITGLSYLLGSLDIEQNLIRPIIRFFENNNDYLDYQVAILLVVLMEKVHDKDKIINNLVTNLINIYPVNKPLSDFIIRKITGKNKKREFVNSVEAFEKQPREFIRMLTVFEPRIELLDKIGIDSSKIAVLYSQVISNGIFIKEHRDLLYEDYHKVVIPNQYFFNEMGTIMTKVIEEKMMKYVGMPFEEYFEEQYYGVLIEDIQLMMSETKSIRVEPEDLSFDKIDLTEEVVDNKGWIRLGYFSRLYESRIRKGDFYNNNKCKIKIGCVVFGDLDEGEYSFDIYNNSYSFGDENYEKTSTLANCNFSTIITTNLIPYSDMYLSYFQRRYLGVKGSILSLLSIEIKYNDGGIIGVNRFGEVVLRYSNWCRRIPDIESISYFIPYSDGAQLEMREAEFNKLCDIVGKPFSMKHKIV